MKKTIRIIPFKGGEIKMSYVVSKFMARFGIKGYHVLLTGANKKILADDTD